ncbi:MAG: XdhC family protein [Acidobacteria bacterium]|nr:XdhC family protein [Acidobacteriota bacterium]
MRELDAILDVWSEAPLAPGVLATVVHVEGSAYRRPGARMLISADGSRRIGTISGGCLEGDVAKKAAWWTASGDPIVRVYDTTSDDDAVWEFGLGCNGVIHILLERVESTRTQELLVYLVAGRRERRKRVVGTVVRSTRQSPYRTGDHLFNFRGELAAPASQTLSERRSRLVHLPAADVFLEYFAPPQRLIIFGAGHDVIPVVALAASIGREKEHAGRTPPDGNAASVPVDPASAVVLMTHNLLLDAKLLPQLRKLRPVYLGVLGPKARFARLLEETELDPSKLDVYSPAGLDLGGDSPAAIALAIVADVQARLHRRDGGSLRWSSRPIHEPAQEVNFAAAPLAIEEPTVATCEIVYG